MNKIDFAAFCNQFAGRPGWVVGRGPTQYKYEDLASVEGPVFFLNDAVSQEVHLAVACPSFFFAHDINMAVWLGAIRSTAVLVVDHPNAGKGLLNGPDDPLLQCGGTVVLYHQYNVYPPTTVLERSRIEIARSEQLYISLGTIHSLLHFAWYIGCSKLYLIGCDGLPEIGYDLRLPNRSGSEPFGSFYIRREQDAVLRVLGVPTEYIGTPAYLIQLEYTVAIKDHKRSEFLELTDEIMSLAAAPEKGLQVALLPVEDSANVFQIRFESDDIRQLLDIVESEPAERFRRLGWQGGFERAPLYLLKTVLR
jgi:hypothetical protein